MKKISLLVVLLFSILGMKAQDSTTDYIYSPDGFEVKTASFTYSENLTIVSLGLYSKDGKTLVAAISGDRNWPEYVYTFYVLDGCETICSGAFQGLCNYHVYIPSSVRYIAPDAIISKTGGDSYHPNRFVGIQDGVTEESNSAAAHASAADSNATEVARYNIYGIKLNEPIKGINIVQKSDGSGEKVLVK